MNFAANDRAALETLLDALAEGELNEPSRVRLNEWLRAHSEARQVYCEVLQLHAMLASDAIEGPHYLDQAGEPITGPVDWPVISALSKVEGSEAEGSEAEGITPPLVAPSPRRPFAVSPLAWSILAASLLFAAYFIGISWDMLGKQLASSPDQLSPLAPGGRGAGSEGELVATIRGSDQVEWSADHSALSPQPSAITANQPLSITSGLVELQLKQGTTLLVEGPAEWTIDGQNDATLKQGKLVAKVPKQAIGFTLKTPASKIIDLGTEFGVKIAGKEAADIVVFQGEVEVNQRSVSPSTGEEAFTPIRLKAGQWRRVSPGLITVPRDALDDEGVFIRTIGEAGKPRAQKRLKLVSDNSQVSASSVWHPENGFFLPGNVVDGIFDDNYHNGKHSWWMAADGVPADLTIDLGAAHKISEIRLQNTHADYNDRGARHVQISLSTDGQSFSPVSELELPNAAGQKLIEIQRIVLPAPLSARYVKLEISTFYGLGAGLNEVQVFAMDRSGH